LPTVFLRQLSAGYDTAIGEALEFLPDAAILRLLYCFREPFY